MKKLMILICMSFIAIAALAADRPNIVWLVTEDNSPDWLRLYSPNGAQMPTIERLAKHGLVFQHAYSCGPVCSVARSTLISGCYAPRVGAEYHRKQQSVPMPDGIKMFPWYLRQAGYYTTNCSKEDYNFNKDEREGVWDNSSRKATYRNRKPDQPFFHVQNYGQTHESSLHFSKEVMEKTKTTTDPATVKLFPYHPDTPTFRYTYARYLDRHMEVDKAMGEFVSKLEEEGLMEDTIIFYYGDHGGVLPRGKGYAYNSGLQVPLIIYIPKKWKHLAPAPAGSRIEGFVQFVDFSATVLNLAGAEIPKGIDGRPFLGKGVTLEELNSRDTAFGYADRFDEKYDLVRTVYKGHFKYVRNYQPFNFDGLHNFYRYKMLAYMEWRELYKAGKLNPEQSQFFEPRPPECLYDLSQDPHELKNLSGDPAYSGTLVAMRKQMQNQVKSMPDLSYIPEPRMLKEAIGNPVAYGQKNKQEITDLIEIADLSLKPFPEIQGLIKEALNSPDANKRYWALITCGSFGTQAAPFYKMAKQIAESDTDLLTRARAAEFLALTGQADPAPVMMAVLEKSTDPVECGLILNSVAMLRDGPTQCQFDFSSFKDQPEWKQAGKACDTVRRRLEYFNDAE